jgi:hypothetical protein
LDGRKLAVCLGHRQLPERSLNTFIAFAAVRSTPRAGQAGQFKSRADRRAQQQLGVDTDCGRPTAGQIVHIEPVTIGGYRITYALSYIRSFHARVTDD